MRRFNAHVTTGTATGVSATAISGNAVFLGKQKMDVADLSAVVTVTAATASLTFTPRWQGSNDNSTFYTVASAPNNPAVVAIATGTSASTSVIVPAPTALHSYQFARFQLVVGGATGAGTDLYSIGYTYRQPRGQARRN